MTDSERFLARFRDFGSAPRNSGSPGGAPLEWGTVYCVTLRGDRVLRGRAYGDRVPILARLLPEMTLAQAAAIGAPAPGLDVG